MKSLKPLLEKKYSWFYLLLFALFLAFVFTFFIHNITYFSKDFKGDYLVSNTSKISEEDGVTFLYKDLNRYVREIYFKSNLKTYDLITSKNAAEFIKFEGYNSEYKTANFNFTCRNHFDINI